MKLYNDDASLIAYVGGAERDSSSVDITSDSWVDEWFYFDIIISLTDKEASGWIYSESDDEWYDIGIISWTTTGFTSGYVTICSRVRVSGAEQDYYYDNFEVTEI